MQKHLKHTTILITGATSGIGEATAILLAKTGAKLVLCGRRTERLNQLKEKLIAEHGIAVALLNIDVSDNKQVQSGLKNLSAEFQDIDVLINNAGCALGLMDLDEADISDWDVMIDINIKGVLYLLRAILPGMYARNKGHIVNIGSTSAHNAYPGGAVYCATKHAINAITKSLNAEAICSGVRVTEVDPGMVETEFSLVRFKGDEKKAAAIYEDFKPLTSEDVADAILYALSRPAHVNIAQIVLYSREQNRVPS